MWLIIRIETSTSRKTRRVHVNREPLMGRRVRSRVKRVIICERSLILCVAKGSIRACCVVMWFDANYAVSRSSLHWNCCACSLAGLLHILHIFTTDENYIASTTNRWPFAATAIARMRNMMLNCRAIMASWAVFLISIGCMCEFAEKQQNLFVKCNIGDRGHSHSIRYYKTWKPNSRITFV